MTTVFHSIFRNDDIRENDVTIRVGQIEVSAPACMAESLFRKIIDEHAEEAPPQEQATMTVKGAGSYHAEVAGPAEMIERLVRSGFGSYS